MCHYVSKNIKTYLFKVYCKVNLGCAFKQLYVIRFTLKYLFQNPSDRIQICKKANGFCFFFQQQTLHCNYDSDIFMTANSIH